LKIYDIYRQENDTVKCGEILNQARKLIPDSLAINVKGYELDYLAMIGDTAKLKIAAMKMFEQYKDNPAIINIIATYMVNNKEYSLAEEMINKGLEIDPESFELNNQMTYRFYNEAADYEKLKEDKLNERPRKYIEAEAALNKATEILRTAVIWAEKAYNIFQDDRQHNVMYRQILVRLEMLVPQELQEKVDSYYK
jgi:tetratricopeptide (TPR) repeat protein